MLLHLVACGIEDPHAASAASEILMEAEAQSDARRVTFLEGLAGCVALQAWTQSLLGKPEKVQERLRKLERLAERAAALPDGECEVLYGRCGFLSAVLFLRQRLDDRQLLSQSATELVRQVVASGQRSAQDGWPLYFEWHEKCYLGGAHGIAGILNILLQFPQELATAGRDASDLVRATAEKLLDHRHLG